MCVFNNELIILGSFTHINGIQIEHIAKWVGGNFTDSCQTVGVEELLKSKINVSPNPADQILHIEFDNLQVREIQILNIYGKSVFFTKDVALTTQINLSDLSNGIYLLIVRTEDGEIIKKIVKS
jgi:hypothetical protein